MITKRKFTFEFQDDEANKITFEYSAEADEKLDTSIENGVSIVYLNRPGMLTLAKTLIKIALAPYPEQFHVHLHKDFNADEPERLTIMLYPDDVPVKPR